MEERRYRYGFSYNVVRPAGMRMKLVKALSSFKR
jgi:hypothetical protein